MGGVRWGLVVVVNGWWDCTWHPLESICLLRDIAALPLPHPPPTPPPSLCSNAMNALSEDNSLLQVPVWCNPWLLVAMAVSLGLHAVILYVPFLSGERGLVCGLAAGRVC